MIHSNQVSDRAGVNTVSLIGMPGAGKSTVGVLLAKLAGLGFVDTDLEIQQREQASLQAILEAQGYEALRDIEAAVFAEIPLFGRVIATGGSAVYAPASMQRLAAAGPVVYLQADLETVEARVQLQPLRGIASPAGQSLSEVFSERTPLYERYADVIVAVRSCSAQQLAGEILQVIAQ